MAEERAKNHHILADRLQRALQSVSVTPTGIAPSSKGGGAGRDIVIEAMPRWRFEDLILPLPARAQSEELVEEQHRASLLRAHGLEPRHRVLLSGPPGNGKTSLAEAIAERLALPFLTVRYDALVGSYLGETNTRLRNLFDCVRSISLGPWDLVPGRSSVRRFWPSLQPSCRNRWIRAVRLDWAGASVAASFIKTPMRRIWPSCCARCAVMAPLNRRLTAARHWCKTWAAAAWGA